MYVHTKPLYNTIHSDMVLDKLGLLMMDPKKNVKIVEKNSHKS